MLYKQIVKPLYLSHMGYRHRGHSGTCPYGQETTTDGTWLQLVLQSVAVWSSLKKDSLTLPRIRNRVWTVAIEAWGGSIFRSSTLWKSKPRKFRNMLGPGYIDWIPGVQACGSVLHSPCSISTVLMNIMPGRRKVFDIQMTCLWKQVFVVLVFFPVSRHFYTSDYCWRTLNSWDIIIVSIRGHHSVR